MMVTCEVVAAQVRKFQAVNTGSLGVTFAMDTKAMEKSGFTVTPDKMPLLAGAPVNASQELTITLQVSLPPPFDQNASITTLHMSGHHVNDKHTITPPRRALF